jgi:hypothetical protein
MRQTRVTRTWLVFLIICFALQGNPLLAQENEKQTSGQSVNPLFKEFTAEESHGFMKNFVLNDALGAGPASIWFGTNAAQVLPTAAVPI